MFLKDLITNYSAYNEWANFKLITWLKTLDEQILVKKVSSSFESIELTIEHIVLAQKFWLGFVSSKNPDTFHWVAEPQTSASILDELLQLSTDIKNKLNQYTEEQLTEKIELNQSWLKNKLPRYEYILHVINHSTFHRGQIITIARNLGITQNIPNTDYNYYNSFK